MKRPEVLKTVLGELTCRIVRASDSPRLAAVFCHGFGAPGSDLVPLAGELISFDPEVLSQVLFVFPEAPLRMDDFGIPGGRAWWPIDMEQLQRAIQLGEFRNLRNDVPPLLPECRRLLASALDELMTQTGLDISQIVLGGFSQGSMLATDVTLHLEQAPAALVVWSGTLLNAHAWEKLVSRRTGLPVLQSHGRQDLILPYAAARWLEELFVKAGLQVQFLTFDGGHTIPWEALEGTAELLRNIVLSETDPTAL